VTTDHDAQLLKGVLGLILLRLLADAESYGYELVTKVHALGLTDVPDGSVYPALARLERDGHLVSRLVASQSGPARKYYALSASGAALLARRERAWRSLVARVTPLFEERRLAEAEVVGQ
jgi:PadR family transcriptional regulator PadR